MADELVPAVDWNAITDALGDDEDFWLKLKAIEALAFNLPVQRVAKELNVPPAKIRGWMQTQHFQNALLIVQQNLQQYIQNDLNYFRIKANQYFDQVLSFDPFSDNGGMTDRMKETLLREKGLVARLIYQGSQVKQQGSGVPPIHANLDESAQKLLAEALREGRVQVVKEITPEPDEKPTADQ